MCSFCGRPRTLRHEEHVLGALVRTIVTCETCHRTLSSTMGVAQPEREPVEAKPARAPEPEPVEAQEAPKRRRAPAKAAAAKKPVAKKPAAAAKSGAKTPSRRSATKK